VIRELTLEPEVEAEIVEARDWYERRSAGRGAVFVAAVDAILTAIQQNPFQYQIVWDDIAGPGWVDFLMD
jgi:hypothetical protein